MTMHVRFEFTTREYRFWHGHEPRGYGMWAFEFLGRRPTFAPASTYVEAKRWIRNHIRSELPDGFDNTITVSVCP
jgi:hypothetical protein